MQLPGAAIRIEHIESGAVYTGETNYAGTAVFTEIKPGAYRIQEIAAPAGYIKSDEVYTATVISGDTLKFPKMHSLWAPSRLMNSARSC